MGKVLKIEVLVDENGEARRALSELDTKVEKVGDSATGTLSPWAQLNAGLKQSAVEAEQAAASFASTNTEVGAAVPLMNSYGASALAASAGVAALVAGVVAVAGVVRESIDFYTEQTGVLDVNDEAVASLAATWNHFKFTVGEALVGNSGDLSLWGKVAEHVLNSASAEVTRLDAKVQELKDGLTFFSSAGPGPATAKRDEAGNQTAAGDLAQFLENEKKRNAAMRATLTLTAADADAMIRTADAAAAAAERTAEKAARAHQMLQKEIERTTKAEHDLYFDMGIFASKQIEAMTAVVAKEMAAQRGLVQAAQMDIVGMLNASNAAKHTAALGGAQSLDAQLEALAIAHAAKIAGIERAGRVASSQGGTEWLAHAQQLTDEAHGAYVTAFDGIVADSTAAMGSVGASLATVGASAESSATRMQQSFSLGFAIIGNDAESAAARVTAALHLAETNMHNSQFFGPNFGTADTINRMGQRNAGLAIRSYETGGPVTRDGPIWAHAGEHVLPKGERSITPASRGGSPALTVNIDATGANFQDEASLEQLADKVQQKLAPLFIRFGG